MADEMHKPGNYYSGRHRIPNVKEFVESLDKDKRDRDRQIEEEQAARDAALANGDSMPHKNETRTNDNQKTVHDPVTGHNVVIENVNKDYMEAARNPVVCCAAMLDHLR